MNDAKFYPIDPLDAYPEAVGTLDQIEHSDGAIWVHLNGKRLKLVGLQSLAFLIGQLEQIRGLVFGGGTEVTRYLPHWNDQVWREYKDGDWVKVADHLAAMVALRADPEQPLTLLDERAEFERIFGISDAVFFKDGKYSPCGFTQYAKDAAEHANTLWRAWFARASLERAQITTEAPAAPTVVADPGISELDIALHEADKWESLYRNEHASCTRLLDTMTGIRKERDALQARLTGPVSIAMPELESEFATWWEDHGQYIRAGGGAYEKSFAYGAFRDVLEMVAALNPTPAVSAAAADRLNDAEEVLRAIYNRGGIGYYATTKIDDYFKSARLAGAAEVKP